MYFKLLYRGIDYSIFKIAYCDPGNIWSLSPWTGLSMGNHILYFSIHRLPSLGVFQGTGFNVWMFLGENVATIG